ncbi:GWxTD domain-containing protein [Spirosoma montaniterrae]|uniref:GWxTD domain-containing protein n=1 Tax=Spirosoma montaniterrae TaxID=1178516 RepID=A0A1P9WYH5_9BACT|nr:GWxTD domain-containing protein [Spirosoma montaniterrae]AQG80419.1 hypothetical protein AWR27_14460 [Spirosoma montaniterrae]
MRTLLVLLTLALLSACSSSKPNQPKSADKRRLSQYDRATAEYDARTRAQRNEPNTTQRSAPLSSDPQQARRPETVVPIRPGDAGPANTGAANPLGGEWAITSIKARFLTIDSSTVRVYMNLTAKTPSGETVKNPSDLIEHFLVAYVMYPDYNNRDRLGYGNVPLSAQNVSREQTGGSGITYLTLSFDVKRPKDVANAILLTEFTETNSGTKARNDLTLRFTAPKLSDRFALFDRNGRQPQLRNYVNVGDSVMIGDANGVQKTLYGVRYRHDFDAASSPMNTSPRPASKSLTVDSTLTITTNQPFVLPKEGLYYFTEDTTDAVGIGLVVADKRFPKLTRPEKLIKPVLYMSTSSEISELSQAQDTKKAFDRYWLSLMSGNEEVARRTLKAYFDRVEEANRLFTTYKEGWKTDKGMIYIVLGAPDRVQRNREREVWVYNRRANVSEVNFTFTKKANQFVDDHYELVRYIEYQPIWYPIVEAWRTGAIRE